LIKLDAGKVVDGIPAITDQIQNSIEPAAAKWNFERSTWNKAECANSGDVCEKEVFEMRIIRNVEEHRLRFSGVLPTRSSSFS